MNKFICEQNIANFQKLLNETTDAGLQHTLQALLSAAKRELAILSSTLAGADVLPFEDRRRRLLDAQAVREQFQSEFDNSKHPYMLLDPSAGLNIVDNNDAYAEATFTDRSVVVGKSLFELFPDNPDNVLADGVSNLYTSLQTVALTGQPHAMAIQRYDIRGLTGEFVERHWQPINTPIRDKDGHLIFLLHHVEDVTDQVLSSSACQQDGATVSHSFDMSRRCRCPAHRIGGYRGPMQEDRHCANGAWFFQPKWIADQSGFSNSSAEWPNIERASSR
jgi:PAS domain-containing protein